MNIYRVLLAVLLLATYVLMFWVFPWFAGDIFQGAAILHAITAFAACFVFSVNWLVDRC